MQKHIAVVGYSLRLPGCDNPDQLWKALLDKQDLVTEVADDRWSKEAWQHPDKKHPGTSYTFKAGSLGDVSGFDAAFFGLSPREVTHMDPQQRLLLEMSWEAMERAGIAPSSLRGTNTGVFMGIASVDYGYQFADDLSAIDANTGTGTAPSIVSNRISYLFDLKGPSVSMDTACSSSMVAFHQACQSIRSGETDQALTGGISLHLHPLGFVIFSKATMLSPEGRCKVFDADGNGYVRSEGGGVFLLKDYDKAVADGDPILAVVAASAVNTDGHKSGLTVPSVDAQSALMRQACERAALDPDQIDYIEAHGTGTPVGDPVETRAISEALGRDRKAPLKIGSVKSNLGHLETASGVAGLAKALLAIEHRQVPATISLREPNPNIPFDEWNIEVVTDTLALPQTGQITIGVNSFGFGGANAHVLLQSPPEVAAAERESVQDALPGRPVPLILSARSADALFATAKQTADYIQNTSDLDLYDLCWSARYRREQHEQAMLVWVNSADQAAEALRAFANDETRANVFTGTRRMQSKGSVWVYSGNGCQWAGMGLKLLQESELIRNAVNEVNELIAQYTDDCDLTYLLGEPQDDDCYALTELAQPALFALQVGVTRYLRAQGLQPEAVTGHSVGEVAAAWASGALTLEQATQVICLRSHYQGQTAGTGQMTAVATSADDVEQLLTRLACQGVELAGINSDRGVTLAGDPDALEQVEAELQAQGVRFKRLNLNYAFHSDRMDAIEAPLKASLANLVPGESRIPFISTVTGQALPGTALNAEYWWHNIRRPVLFAPAIRTCLDNGFRTFVELGAHPVLRGYINECLRANDAKGQVIATLGRERDSAAELERARAELVLSGARLEEAHWFPVQGRVVTLPVYPWQRQSYWKPQSPESLGLMNRQYVHPLLGYVIPQHPGCWESQLDTGRLPWLADHVVGDAVVFPGAGFAETALAAVDQQLRKQATDTQVIDIEDLEIRAPLLLEEGQSRIVRTRLLAEDGTLEISARPHAKEGDWQPHVKARWFAGSAGRLLSQKAGALPERQPDFYREQHLAAASHIGLDYGPAFQAVTEGWIDGNAVIARCEPSERILETSEGQLLHPGILDTAFQLFIPLLAEEAQKTSRSDYGFVPVQIGRLQFSCNQKGVMPAQIRVELKRRSPHSLLADVALFDGDGHAVAVLTDVRFRAVALRKSSARAVARLDMPLVPRPLPRVASALGGAELVSVIQPLLEDQSGDVMVTELEPLLDTLALATLNDVLTRTPVRLTQLGDAQMRWAQNAIAQGVFCEGEAGELRVTEPPEVDARTVWELLVNEYPGAYTPALAVGRLGLHLSGWLEHSAELPELDERTWTAIYRARQDAGRLTAMQQSLAEQVSAQLERQTPEQHLMFAEITAGEMVFTQALADRLQRHSAEMAFVSASASVVSEARSHLVNQSQVQALHWDQSVWPEEIAHLDLAIVHLDFMRPSAVQQLLYQLRGALRPEGQLVLMGHPPALWLEQLYGNQLALLDQEGTLQPAPAHWCELLEKLGFDSLQCIEDDQQPGSAFAVTAQKPKGVELAVADDAPLYLVLSDQYSEAVASAMQAHLPNARLVAGMDELAAQLADTSERPVHLVVLQDAWAPDSRAMATRRCAALRDLVKTLEPSEVSATCTVITAGVGEAQLDRAAPSNSENVIAQAAVWGFARSLMNETDLPLQLIDVPGEVERIPAEALGEALACVSAEEEQYLTADGERFVPRLMEVEPPANEAAPERPQSLTLGFDQPGQLRNLRWQARELPMPGDQDVVVDVKATGLNFRDVMYTLGLLSDEAIENGFSGPTLGLEFAGIVTAVGNGVSEFSPGDTVVGFGPSSFSTRVIAGAHTLAHLPGNIGFEAAATIPTTFFTVYYALKHLARLQPGERVLIHGAAGGVGLAAIQVARLLGAQIVATVGSQAKQDMVRLLGVEAIYDSRSHSFGEDILADTSGEGVDVVLNSLAGEAINQNLRVLRPFGRFLELGKRDFYENTAIGLRPFRNNISYFGVDSDQLMKVQPSLTQSLFREMMALFENGELHPLPYTAFSASRVVDAFRYMQQAKQIGKVVVNYPQPSRAESAPESAPTEAAALQLPGDKTFLVTGGLGGFGLRTAVWLAEKGVRHLALLSRRGQAGEEDLAVIEQLVEEGVEVRCYACDVSDRDQLAQTLGHIEQQQPPLGGVVHAAAVFSDALVQNMTDQQIEQVLAAKAFGAQYLHELTADRSLELFVLFSSATTLFGNPGQANYVAANLALEALSQARRAQGLAATCVRWGAIDDAGYLARNGQIKQALQSRMGGKALTADRALAMLEQMLLEDQPLLGIMEFDWSALSRFLPRADAARYQLVARSHDGSGHEHGGGDLLAELLGMAPEEQVERVTEELRHSIGQILMLPADQIDPQQSLYDLGFDSLMGVELVTDIEDRFGVQLPAMAISESPTIAKLTARLLERITDTSESDDDQPVARLAAQHGVTDEEVANA